MTNRKKFITDIQLSFLLRVKEAHELGWIEVPSLYLKVIKNVVGSGTYLNGSTEQYAMNVLRSEYKPATLPIL